MTEKFIVENTNMYKEKEKETKEDALFKALKKCVGSDGFIKKKDAADDGYVSYFFGLKDNYIYSMDSNIESDYLRIELSFGSIQSFVDSTSINNVLTLINDSNNHYRVSKAIVTIDKQGETSFLVSYEAFLYPKISMEALDMHLTKSMNLLESHSSLIMRAKALAEQETQKNTGDSSDDNHQ